MSGRRRREEENKKKKGVRRGMCYEEREWLSEKKTDPTCKALYGVGSIHLGCPHRE